MIEQNQTNQLDSRTRAIYQLSSPKTQYQSSLAIKFSENLFQSSLAIKFSENLFQSNLPTKFPKDPVPE